MFRPLRVLLATAVLAASAPLRAADAPDYQTEVAPVLKRYCAGCHNAADKDGGLSLETFDQLLQGGEHGPAILSGDGKSSRLVRVLTGQAKPAMPPKKSEQPKPEEVALLKAWIDAGAKGPAGAEAVQTTLVTPAVKPDAGVPRGIAAVAYSPDGKLIAAARAGEVELLAADTRAPVRTLGGHPGKVNAVAFSADGTQLVAASGVAGLYGRADVWNVRDGSLARSYRGHRDTLYAAALRPDGKVLATGSYDRRVTLWDTATGKPVRTLDGHNDAVYDLAFSPDGAVLATASGDGTVKLWRVDNGARLDTLNQPTKEQYAVAFSPDGRHVVAGGADNRIRVWEFVSRDAPKTNPLVHTRYAHEGAVVRLAFTRDGKTLASAAEDRTVKLWETDAFTQTFAYEKQPDAAPALALAPGGDALVVGRMDGSLQTYPVKPPPAAGTKPTAAAPAPAVPAEVPPAALAEAEPNDAPAGATPVTVPCVVSGVIHATRPGQKVDADLYRFEAKAGQVLVLEVDAARSKSPLDSRLEVLDAAGRPVPRVLLRAVRDTYFNFRSLDSDGTDDVRLHHWEEMELDEYLYANGEVMKLWLYPQRGGDHGFKVYPGAGKRHAYFDTTPVAHALGEPCYVVEQHPPGSTLIPNGLPVFPVPYENDDDALRQLGTDSRLTFTAPADGTYLVRVTDSHGFHGAGHTYRLTVRPARPDFRVTVEGRNPVVGAGGGREFQVTADRVDGFDGDIRVDVAGLPPGFTATTPLVIPAGHLTAFGTITAAPDAPPPTAENARAARVSASAVVGGKPVTRAAGELGEVKLAGRPKVLVTILPPGGAPELTVAPGETVTARVRVERNGFAGPVRLYDRTTRSNLPHGVIVDNLGLSGLLIPEGGTERTFVLTAAKWVPETTRPFHLKADVEGNPTSAPVAVRVRARQPAKDEPKEDGFTALFDGKTLDGWEGQKELFSVRDGAIHAETTKDAPLKKNTFLAYTKREFADFELRFDYKVVGGNSGMQYRSERLPEFGMKGYQADFENQNRYTGMFFEEGGRLFLAYPGEFVTVRPLADGAKPKDPKAKAVLDKVPFATREEVFSHVKDPSAWHSMTIVARGNTFVHVLDGRVMSVAVDDDAKNFRKSGYLGLQVHQGPPMTIDLKNVRIRELK